jgi:hypothetical protein
VKTNEQHQTRYQSQRGVRSLILDLNEGVRKNLEKKAKAGDDPRLRRLQNEAVPQANLKLISPKASLVAYRSSVELAGRQLIARPVGRRLNAMPVERRLIGRPAGPQSSERLVVPLLNGTKLVTALALLLREMVVKVELVIAQDRRLATAALGLVLALQASHGSPTQDMLLHHQVSKAPKALVEPWTVLRVLHLLSAPEENSVELVKPLPEPLVLEYWLTKAV